MANSDSFTLNKSATSSEAVLGISFFAWLFATVLFGLVVYFAFVQFKLIAPGVWNHTSIILEQGPFFWASVLTTAAGKTWISYIIYYGAIGVIFIPPLYIAWKVGHWSSQTKGVVAITKGDNVETNTEVALKTARWQLKKADGLHIHPKLRIHREQEVAHILTWGATRSGKSQTLAWLLEDIYGQEERAAVFDLKGDLVSRMAGKRGVIILNPADRRSVYWDIASDLKTAADCRIFAAALIPKSPKDSQPMFGDNARLILAGLLIFLVHPATAYVMV